MLLYNLTTTTTTLILNTRPLISWNHPLRALTTLTSIPCHISQHHHPQPTSYHPSFLALAIAPIHTHPLTYAPATKPLTHPHHRTASQPTLLSGKQRNNHHLHPASLHFICTFILTRRHLNNCNQPLILTLASLHRNYTNNLAHTITTLIPSHLHTHLGMHSVRHTLNPGLLPSS